MPDPVRADRPWWREAVIYQVYPLSFIDSDGDGFGDIPGIRSKLGYLADTLGVDAVWLSPFYKSPMRDWGYDVADHCDVDPIFGKLRDVEELIEEAHRRGLKVVVDYVMNHTSDQHGWFVESRSSRDDPKRDWYVWRDGEGGEPPNNWESVFGGRAWTFDDTTGQFYRHTYLREQPDLNWRNPLVVEAMMDVARFWMDRGVDGFRVDAAHQMMKDPLERDNPPAPLDYPRPWKDMGSYDRYIHLYDFGHPDVHEAHRRFRAVVDSYERDAVTIGEIHIFDLPEWASYYGEHLDQLHMPFNFHLMAAEWSAASVRATIESVLWNVPIGGWTNWTMGNHDETRLATRLPKGHHRLVAVLLLTLRGTPFIYYGDELGMVEAVVPEGVRKDPWGMNSHWLSRDGCRTPMLWSTDAHAGFTSPEGSPWLPVTHDHESESVEAQLTDPASTLNLYRRLIEFRRGSRPLRHGSFLSHPSSTEEVFAYRRESDYETVTIALNFSEVEQTVSLGRGRVVISTNDPHRADQINGSVDLEPGEGVVVSHP